MKLYRQGIYQLSRRRRYYRPESPYRVSICNDTCRTVSWTLANGIHENSRITPSYRDRFRLPSDGGESGQRYYWPRRPLSNFTCVWNHSTPSKDQASRDTTSTCTGHGSSNGCSTKRAGQETGFIRTAPLRRTNWKGRKCGSSQTTRRFPGPSLPE